MLQNIKSITAKIRPFHQAAQGVTPNYVPIFKTQHQRKRNIATQIFKTFHQIFVMTEHCTGGVTGTPKHRFQIYLCLQLWNLDI